MADENTNANAAGAETTSVLTDGVVKTDAGVAKTDAGAKDPAAAAKDTAAAGSDPAKKPADGDPDKGKVAGAPEKYEDFTLPEGFTVDAKELEEVQGLFKEANLDQPTAQKMIDKWTGKQTAAAEANAKAWTDLRGDWVKTAKSDKEFGGQNFDANVGVAKNALKAFGTPELNEALTLTGVGDHPEFIRFVYRIGKAIGEDKLTFGGAKGTPKAPEDILYGEQK
jgi:hypothetical protein